MYYYHETKTEHLYDIQQEGIQPTSFGQSLVDDMGEIAFPDEDEMEDYPEEDLVPRTYFLKSEPKRPMYGEVLLRFPRTQLPSKHIMKDVDYYTFKEIPPDVIEVKMEDRWVLLPDFSFEEIDRVRRNASERAGYCYREAYLAALELIGDQQSITIIHGCVRNPKSKKWFGHAWVEYTDSETGVLSVLEPEHREVFSRKEFADAFGGIREDVYLIKEVGVLVSKTKHWGPYTEEEQEKHLG